MELELDNVQHVFRYGLSKQFNLHELDRNSRELKQVFLEIAGGTPSVIEGMNE